MNTPIGSLLVAMSTAAIFAGCIDDPAAPSAATWAQATGAATIPGRVPFDAVASRHADVLVADRPVFLHASPNDEFAQTGVESIGGLSYVAYERTHLGLPVIGGDFVLAIDGAGQMAYHSIAQERPIEIPSITPKLSQVDAESIAARQLLTVTGVEGTRS